MSKGHRKLHASGAYLVGIDVGTTSVKVALFDGEGGVVASHASPVTTSRRRPGWVEQAPDEWARAVVAGLAAVLAKVAVDSVAAIGLCSQVNTHVFVGADGQPLAPAIVWQDGRADELAARLHARVPEAQRLAWWGAPLPIDASHVLPRMAWMARAEPKIWGRTRWVMAPKDFCLMKLTGEVFADPLSSFGVVDASLRYIPDLVALVPGAAERLPQLGGIAEVVGPVREGLPGAGLPVANTTMDAWTGMLGAGAAGEGSGAYLSGTSEVGGIVSQRRIPTPGVIVFPECEGITQHLAPTQAGGASVAWLAAVLGRSAGDISALAAKSDPARRSPIFLPHLEGERAPLWDINARASFAGVDGSMGAPELARAVLEGVAYSVRLLMSSLEASAGVVPDRLRHAGGGARSDVWCQIRADALGKPIDRAACLDSGLAGGAMLAGFGVGRFGSLAEAAAQVSRVERTFEPDPARKAMHDEGFGRYNELYRRLKGFG